MTAFVRHGARFGRDLAAYVMRTGRWWLPIVVLVLVITSVVIATAKVVVPTVTYTLF